MFFSNTHLFSTSKKLSNFLPPNQLRACAHELNALFTANAHNFPSIVVRSRTTYTRADTAAVAARIASSPSAATGGGQQTLPPLPHSVANQHLALAAHVLSVAFAPFPTAAMSLYEIEAPSWLAAWARKWCGNGSAAVTAPATPRNSPAASCNSLSSYDSDESGGASSSCNVVVVKLMALHGYAEGQPACGQGAGLGEPQTGGGRPARTVFLPIW